MAPTRKVCRGKALKRTMCRGYKGRRYECGLKLQGKEVAISVNGVHQKHGFLSINKEHIYIARDHSRLNASLPLSVPVRCNDTTQTVRIGATTLQVPSCRAYERVKEYLNQSH